MFWLLLIICLLLIPAIIGFAYEWEVDFGLSITVFAATSIVHFVSQVIFAILEKRRTTREKDSVPPRKVAVQITGWKEDPLLFEKCLRSIAAQETQPEIVTFCSDGNEQDDEYMVDIFQKVFRVSYVLRLPEAISPESPIPSVPKGLSHLCITQPHHGKRDAMYTQTKLLLTMGIDYILFVDSDTILDAKGISYLLSTAVKRYASAVTGDVCIHNEENLLSSLVSLKYWFAFNLERGAQSFFGNVSCISGPFGLYSVQSLQVLIDPWKRQTFMGKECTFGDDRHLTNLILKSGGTTYYDYRAVCYTDTPVSYHRFITQQTRWSKSFIREYVLNFGWFNTHQLWLLYDLSFMTVYSLLLIFYIGFLCIQNDFTNMSIFVNAVLGSTYIRAFYAYYETRNPAFFFFPLYSYIYLGLLIPLKLWAMFTVNVTTWGTGNRMKKTSKIIDLVPVQCWCMFLAASLIISLGRKGTSFSLVDAISLGVNVIVTIGSYAYYRWFKPRLDNTSIV